MKRLWAAIALLLIVAAIGFYGKYTVDQHIDRTVEILEQIQSDDSGDQQALSDSLDKQWEQTQKKISIWLSHTHIEEVNTQITLIRQAINTNATDDKNNACAVALEYLREMQDGQIPYLENIF